MKANSVIAGMAADGCGGRGEDKVFQADFPERHIAEKPFVRFIVDRVNDRFGKTRRIRCQPQKCAGIEQKFHRPHSRSSSLVRGASASSGTWNAGPVVSPTFAWRRFDESSGCIVSSARQPDGSGGRLSRRTMSPSIVPRTELVMAASPRKKQSIRYSLHYNGQSFGKTEQIQRVMIQCAN